MAGKVLVATDGAERSARAIAVAVGVARAMNVPLVGCTATPPYGYYGLGDVKTDAENQFLAATGAAAIERLAEIERAARAAGVSCTTVIKEQQHPHRAILQAAQENDCSLIVMASHGRSEIASLLLGSETQKVLALADRPVLVVR
jgi:nucleotide-binding universal stress UspA family protein